MPMGTIAPLRTLSETEKTGISVSNPNEKRENLARTGNSTRENDWTFSTIEEFSSSVTSDLGSPGEFFEKIVKKLLSLEIVNRFSLTILWL